MADKLPDIPEAQRLDYAPPEKRRNIGLVLLIGLVIGFGVMMVCMAAGIQVGLPRPVTTLGSAGVGLLVCGGIWFWAVVWWR